MAGLPPWYQVMHADGADRALSGPRPGRGVRTATESRSVPVPVPVPIRTRWTAAWHGPAARLHPADD